MPYASVLLWSFTSSLSTANVYPSFPAQSPGYLLSDQMEEEKGSKSWDQMLFGGSCAGFKETVNNSSVLSAFHMSTVVPYYTVLYCTVVTSKTARIRQHFFCNQLPSGPPSAYRHVQLIRPFLDFSLAIRSHLGQFLACEDSAHRLGVALLGQASAIL